MLILWFVGLENKALENLKNDKKIDVRFFRWSGLAPHSSNFSKMLVDETKDIDDTEVRFSSVFISNEQILSHNEVSMARHQPLESEDVARNTTPRYYSERSNRVLCSASYFFCII